MNKITSFFWVCSGADISLLKKCPTEASKYVGIGATVFFTGVFAALAGGYALYTVFDNLWLSLLFGILWGLLIFNLDRYIVSSMRKEGLPRREFTMALPRIILAIIISIVIAKPLELKIFEKEIQPELLVMEQEAYAKVEQGIKLKFNDSQDSLKAEIAALKHEIMEKTMKRDELRQIAQEEADGTGGSKRRNLGPIYKVKKTDADRADEELIQLMRGNGFRINTLEKTIEKNDSLMSAAFSAIERSKFNGPAARMEALDRITQKSEAIYWTNWFIMLLFIALETAPVFVKLISPKGPYDNLLKTEEHRFSGQEIEEVATLNAEIKARTAALPETERNFITNQLDSALK